MLLDNFIGASADLEAAERLHKARAELAQQQMRNPLEPLLLKATRRARGKRLGEGERSDSERAREATRERERSDSEREATREKKRPGEWAETRRKEEIGRERKSL